MDKINESINKEIEKERIIWNDFESLWYEFDMMMKLRNAGLIQLKKTKLKLALDVILIQQNPIIVSQLHSLQEYISEKIDIIKDEQDLISNIKRIISRLQLYKIVEYNNEIKDLIVLLNQKNDSICLSTLNDIRVSLLALRGKNITKEDFRDDDIDSLDDEIENKSLSLGLKDIENK